MDVRFELQEGGHPESCESIGLKFKGIQVHVYLLCIYIYILGLWVFRSSQEFVPQQTPSLLEQPRVTGPDCSEMAATIRGVMPG